MRTITCEAHAKINLALDVLGRREDGYHLVRMVMQEIGIHDSLKFTVQGISAGSPYIALHTESQDIPTGPDNLIVHAACVMCDAYDIRDTIDIELTKNIPVAAGLAGGSTDAACVFRALRDLYVPEIPDEELQALALPLGADIPYCIAGGTRLAEGIGEKLTGLAPAPRCHLVLVKPPQGISTGEIYRAIDAMDHLDHPDIDGMIACIESGDLAGMAGRCSNVLESVTGKRIPLIGQIEAFLMGKGALTARMSGSGPSVFAIFEEKERARAALEAFRREEAFKDCYSVCTDFV